MPEKLLPEPDDGAIAALALRQAEAPPDEAAWWKW
jgi:hypothetical protein